MYISDRLFHQQDINSVKRPHLYVNKEKLLKIVAFFQLLTYLHLLVITLQTRLKPKALFNILARDFLLNAEVVHKSSSGHSGVIRAFQLENWGKQ